MGSFFKDFFSTLHTNSTIESIFNMQSSLLEYQLEIYSITRSNLIMKKVFFVFTIVISTLTAIGQSFEGKVSYANEYVSHKWFTSDERLTKLMGSKQSFFIKGGTYKSITNGTFQSTLYINKENKLYAKVMDSDVLYWTDASEQAEKLISVKTNKNVITILGYQCDEVILTYESGTYKYYFNSEISIDPQLYINHRIGNWYDFLKQSNALALKMVFDSDKFSLISIATEIKKMTLDAVKFNLPAGSKIKKNPF